VRAFAANNIISSRRTCFPWMSHTSLIFVSISLAVVGHVARLPGYSLVTMLLPVLSSRLQGAEGG